MQTGIGINRQVAELPIGIALNELADEVVISNATGNEDLFINAVQSLIANIRTLRNSEAGRTPMPAMKNQNENWKPVTKALICNPPGWFTGKLWIAYRGAVTIGRYQWREGQDPDRFYTALGDLHALECSAMPYQEPEPPR